MCQTPPLIHFSPTHFKLNGQKLVNFGGSDYFRMAWDPAVRKTVAKAAIKLGHNSYAASRRTTGNHPKYAEYEEILADFGGSEAAVLTSSGYLAPIVAAQGLGPDFTHVLVDSKGHGCLHDAAAVTGLPVAKFTHGDVKSLRDAVRSCGRRARIFAMCDGLSAHLGTVTPLAAYLNVLPQNAMLLVDDAHGFCVLGANGRGSLEHLGINDSRVIVMGTLSKALGTCGGVLFCSKEQREKMQERSRAFAGGSPVSLSLVAGGMKSLQIMRNRGRMLRRKLNANVDPLRKLESVTGVPVAEHVGPMFSCAPQTAGARQRLCDALTRAGIYPPLIRYGGGPADCFFRFAISTAHTAEQLGALRDVLAASIEP